VNRLWRGGYLGLIFLFFYLPIAILIVFSFNDSKYRLTWQGFSWRWYEALFNNEELLQVALNSVTLALISATIATLMGTLAAVVFYRYRFFGKRLLHGLLYVVIMSPDIVMGISLLILFVSLNMPLGFWTLLLAHVTFCLPFVVVTVYGRLAGFDESMVEAARDLGAGEWLTFRKILLPLLMPAVIAGWLLSFTLSMDDVIISFFVTGPEFEILPLKIYSMVRVGVKPEVNALCTLMFGLTLVLVLVAQFLLKEKRE
jgi:spermidine/putrescine transport system permease protein